MSCSATLRIRYPYHPRGLLYRAARRAYHGTDRVRKQNRRYCSPCVLGFYSRSVALRSRFVSRTHRGRKRLAHRARDAYPQGKQIFSRKMGFCFANLLSSSQEERARTAFLAHRARYADAADHRQDNCGFPVTLFGANKKHCRFGQCSLALSVLFQFVAKREQFFQFCHDALLLGKGWKGNQIISNISCTEIWLGCSIVTIIYLFAN